MTARIPKKGIQSAGLVKNEPPRRTVLERHRSPPQGQKPLTGGHHN